MVNYTSFFPPAYSDYMRDPALQKKCRKAGQACDTGSPAKERLDFAGMISHGAQESGWGRGFILDKPCAFNKKPGFFYAQDRCLKLASRARGNSDIYHIFINENS